MQTARPRAGARIPASVHTLSTLTYLLSITTRHYLGETADNKQTVDEEMMGVAWLLALQAFAQQHAPRTLHAHATPMMRAAPMMPTAVPPAGEGGQKRRQGDTCLKGCCFGGNDPSTTPEVRFRLPLTRGDSRERALALRARAP
mgnify:CR=1 FL=1